MLLPDPTGYFKTVHTGHDYIQQNQIDLTVGKFSECFFTI
jgi:hypothetical protein